MQEGVTDILAKFNWDEHHHLGYVTRDSGDIFHIWDCFPEKKWFGNHAKVVAPRVYHSENKEVAVTFHRRGA
jgi:hypothetical protein